MADPLDGTPGTPPAENRPPAESRVKKMKCEFCECELVGAGDYLKLSDKAKKLRNLEETNSILEASNTELKRQLEEAKRLQPEPRPARTGVW